MTREELERETTRVATTHGCDRGTFTVCWAEHERGAVCRCKEEARQSFLPPKDPSNG